MHDDNTTSNSGNIDKTLISDDELQELFTSICISDVYVKSLHIRSAEIKDRLEEIGFIVRSPKPGSVLSNVTFPDNWIAAGIQGYNDASFCILDEMNRVRVKVFRKDLSNDRHSVPEISIVSAAEYAIECVKNNKQIILDREWISPRILRSEIRYRYEDLILDPLCNQEEVTLCSRILKMYGG